MREEDRMELDNCSKACLKLPMPFHQGHPELSPEFSHCNQASCMLFWFYPVGCFSVYGLH